MSYKPSFNHIKPPWDPPPAVQAVASSQLASSSSQMELSRQDSFYGAVRSRRALPQRSATSLVLQTAASGTGPGGGGASTGSHGSPCPGAPGQGQVCVGGGL
jgi:hypothetical protein